MISVCKTFRFEAAHHLPEHEGKCRNLHGHSYVLEVEVQGNEEDIIFANNLKEAMVIDFSSLKETIMAEFYCYDHADLNLYFNIPTAEVMVMYFVSCLKGKLPGLCRVRLYETVNSYAEWKRCSKGD